MNKNKIISSLFYKYIERLFYQGIGFIVQIILARILDPSDYGVLTMLTVFITISQVFVQGGLNTALIQDKNVTEKDYSSVFWVSLSIAVSLYGILFVSAPAIAAYYNESSLTDFLRVLALILLPGAFNSIQNAKITREMQFKKLLYCTSCAAVASGIVGISMAYFKFGVWALVGQQITNQVVSCIAMLFVVKWRPKMVVELGRVKVLFSFGWKLLCANLMNTINKEVQNLVIGKKYSSGDLGYYNRGKQFPQIITENLNGSIQSVMLPALSKEQDDKSKMKAMMRRSMSTSSFIIFPMMVGLAVVANPLVSLLLTDKWLPCVPYIWTYCFIYALYPIQTANLQAINAQGRSDLLLKLQILKDTVGLIILCIIIFCFDSPLIIALGVAVTSLISCFINAFPNKNLLNYSYSEQIKDIIPSIILSAVMGIVISLVVLLKLPAILTIVFQVIIGAVLYIGMAWLFSLECFVYLKRTMNDFLKKR